MHGQLTCCSLGSCATLADLPNRSLDFPSVLSIFSGDMSAYICLNKKIYFFFTTQRHAKVSSVFTLIIIHQTRYEKSDWSRAFNQFTIACELDMINAIYYIKVSGIASGNKLIKTMRYSHM